MSIGIPVKELYCDSVGVEPIDYDFGEGFGERWEPVYPEKYNEDDEQGSDSYCPMMNYYYPLPADFERDMNSKFGNITDGATRLDKYGGNVCLVYLMEDGKYALALTGGGMDLSWDICEGYMLLGYLPPLHFCDLPHFGGDKLTAKKKWVINGCLRSCSVSMYRAKNQMRDLKALKKKMKGDK